MPAGFRDPRSLVALPFQPVDIDGQGQKLKLRERGRDDGLRNIPAADADSPSAEERSIALLVEGERARLGETLTAHLKAQADALAQLDTAMDIAALRKDAAHAVSRLEEVHVAWKGEIPRVLRAAREAKAEYEAFREHHGLQRPARDTGSKALALSWLAFFVVVESVLNGTFFAEGSAAGLVGGIGVALSVSVVNVVLVGFLVGWGPCRWLAHRSLPLRVLGLVLVVCGLALALVANGFVAHFRDFYERAGDGVRLTEVWAHLFERPFELARLQSWLLFLLGLAFAGLGAWKGYHLDDPYPGYGPVARRWAAAEQTYLSNRQMRLEDAAEARDDAKTSIESGIERLRGAAQQRDQILAQRARMIADFSVHEAHLAEAANALIAVYRDANRATRTTPEPPGFREPFGFAGSALDTPAMRALRSVEGVTEHEAEALLRELDRLREDVLTAYRAVFDDAPAEV
jgi:hypothetical protein